MTKVQSAEHEGSPLISSHPFDFFPLPKFSLSMNPCRREWHPMHSGTMKEFDSLIALYRNQLPGCRRETGIDFLLLLKLLLALCSLWLSSLSKPISGTVLSLCSHNLVHVYFHIYFCHAHLLMSISFRTDVFALILSMLLKYSIRLP